MVQHLDDLLIAIVTRPNQVCVDRHIHHAYLVNTAGKAVGEVKTPKGPDGRYRKPLTWRQIFGTVIRTPEVVRYVVAADQWKTVTRLHVFTMPEDMKPRDLARKCLQAQAVGSWIEERRGTSSPRLNAPECVET